jgi:hypothetical protein
MDMRALLLSVWLLPVLAWSAAPDVATPHKPKAAQPAAKQTVKQTTKHDAVKHAPVHAAKTKPVVQKPAVVPVAAPMTASNVAVDEHRTVVAEQVHTGHMVCELGNSVTVTPDTQAQGSFFVQMRQHRYHMTPVVSATGAIRLEDTQAGAMWLQLPNKSMLMNSKLGQRMADECQSPAQMAVAEAMKSGPPSTLLDGPNVAKK